jgi:hypothetical protein
VAFSDEGADLFDESRHLARILGLTFDEQIVALRSNADVQEAFEVAEIVVVGPEERGKAVLADGDAAGGSGSDRDISLCYKELTDAPRVAFRPLRVKPDPWSAPLGADLDVQLA